MGYLHEFAVFHSRATERVNKTQLAEIEEQTATSSISEMETDSMHHASFSSKFNMEHSFTADNNNVFDIRRPSICFSDVPSRLGSQPMK